MEKDKIAALSAGIFLISLSTIILEISLTKIFSVTLWYHFAYLVVSLALYGIGAGGLMAFFLQGNLKARYKKILARAGFLQFLSIVACLYIIVNFDLKPALSLAGITHLAVLYVCCSAPFIFTGFALAVIIQYHYVEVPKLYFADLLGAATGCIAFWAAITYFSGPTVVIVASMCALAASACFFLSEAKRVSFSRLLLLTAVACALLLVNARTRIFAIKYTKESKEFSNLLYEKWSPLARITVHPEVYFLAAQNREYFGWGMSAKYKQKEQIRQMWVEQDSCAGTPISEFDGDISKLEYLKYDITALPYYMKPDARVFIIGCGGGRDVLTALAFGSKDILACDINPIMVNLVKERYRDFTGNVYDRPGIRVEVAEARNFIRRSNERFDIIQIPLIDSWAATTAGAFSMAENSLYTVEAFKDYCDHLSENGVLAVTRFLFRPRSQCIKVAIVARKALEEAGVADPQANIMVVGTSRALGMATVLVKKKPFTLEEMDRVRKAAHELDFPVLYAPTNVCDSDFTMAITTKPLEEYLGLRYYDLRPSTDDRPFFFQMIYFSKVLDLIRGRWLSGQKFNYYAPAVILALIFLSMILIVVFYLAPLAFSKKVKSLPRAWALYFVFLGAGFMFVEIPLIQKGGLYLGHPTYGFTIVLFSLLIFGGLGSHLSGRIEEERLVLILGRMLLLIAVLIGFGAFGIESLFYHTIGLSFPARVAVVVSLCGIMALFMGGALPSGVRLLGRSSETSIPWVWALNGGASVLGSIVAMAIAMSYGYRLVLVLGAIVYACSSFAIRAALKMKATEAIPSFQEALQKE